MKYKILKIEETNEELSELKKEKIARSISLGISVLLVGSLLTTLITYSSLGRYNDTDYLKPAVEIGISSALIVAATSLSVHESSKLRNLREKEKIIKMSKNENRKK